MKADLFRAFADSHTLHFCIGKKRHREMTRLVRIHPLEELRRRAFFPFLLGTRSPSSPVRSLPRDMVKYIYNVYMALPDEKHLAPPLIVNETPAEERTLAQGHRFQWTLKKLLNVKPELKTAQKKN
jgi:hypothetical protein